MNCVAVVNYYKDVVGDLLNISQTRMSTYERGRSIPSEILKQFACFYGVTTDYILRLLDNKSGLSVGELLNSEHQLLVFYRGLSQECEQMVDRMVRGYALMVSKAE